MKNNEENDSGLSTVLDMASPKLLGMISTSPQTSVVSRKDPEKAERGAGKEHQRDQVDEELDCIAL